MKTELLERFYRLEDSHWWFSGRRRIIHSQLHAMSARGPLLDVGCGTGGTLAHLNSLGPAYGVDSARQAIACCRERGLQVSLASALELPYRSGTFNTVLALDVIEHIDDDVAALRELGRVLMPDGLLLVTVPALPLLWSGHDDANEHRRRYLRSTLADALAEAGFETRRLTYYNSLLLPLAGLRKLIQHGRGEGGAHLERLPPVLNSILGRVLSSEATLIRWRDLPLGASLIATCQPAA